MLAGAGLAWAALAAVGAGMMLAVQGPINAHLGRTLGAPLAAAFVSFAAGAAAAALVLVLSGQEPRWRDPPGWLYPVGGCLGVAVVVAAVTLTPRIGVTSFLSCLIFGQLLAGLALDAWGLFGMPQQDLSVGRIAAVGCVFVGVLLLRVL